MKNSIQSQKYSMLEIFMKAKENSTGKLIITDKNGIKREYNAGKNYYKWLKISLDMETIYEVELIEAEISIAYLSGNKDMMETGVCFLAFIESTSKYLPAKTFDKKNLEQVYNTPFREQFHFVPYKNWVNDPNGLCWYKGYYHLYFQANPHKQEWNNMYWGHAVSKDLIHWTHLPYVLEPQANLYQDATLKGGAFSGSAVALEEETIFYLTRHEGPQEDGCKTEEWQTMTRSKDMIHFEEEKIIIQEKPDGVGHDFRDPKVFQVGEEWYLVLASNLKGKSTILLYSSQDMEKWTYVGPLVVEPDEASTTFECPDCFELDGKYVAVAALMRHRDIYNRYQMTRYYVGDFINQTLEVEAIGNFDFGSNFYAVQTFEQEGKRIAIGWISDFYEEHIFVKDGAYGSFGIPRILSVKNRKLYMEPVPEIYTLKSKKIYSGNNQHIDCKSIAGNSYYVKAAFAKNTDFEMVLGKNKVGAFQEQSIQLIQKNGVTELKTNGVKSEKIRFVADVEEVLELEIFVDRRLVEVFINNGQSVGAKLFYNTSLEGVFEAHFELDNAVTDLEVFTMNSIWDERCSLDR